jgi:hypothetical protein
MAPLGALLLGGQFLNRPSFNLRTSRSAPRAGLRFAALVAVMWISALVAVPGAAHAERPTPADGVLTAGDVPGSTALSQSPRAWLAALPKRLRNGQRGAVQVRLTPSAQPPIAIVSRAALFADARTAAGVANRLMSGTSLGALAGALGVTALQARSAVTRTWREGALVCQLVYWSADSSLQSSQPAQLVALLRGTVRAVARQTGWQTLQAQAGVERTVTKATALEAFATAIAPLPGVRVSSRHVGRIGSVDPALDWTLDYYNQLTRAQRAVVNRELAKLRPKPSRHAAAGSRAVRGQSAAAPPIALIDPALSRKASGIADELGQAMKLTPSFVTLVILGTFAPTKSGAIPVGESIGWDAHLGATGPIQTCVIQLNRNIPTAGSDEVLAHEVFHCFQMQILGSYAKLRRLTAAERWLVEGGAIWAACQISVGPIGEGWYTGYIQSQDAPSGQPGGPNPTLFQRTYDAVGFFAEIASQDGGGVDPFLAMKQALTAPSNNQAWTELVGGAAETLYGDWAASFAQDVSRGPEWRPGGACYQPAAVEQTPIVPIAPPITGRQIPIPLSTPEVSTKLYTLDVKPGAYIIDVKVDAGTARVSSLDGVHVDDLVTPSTGDQYYCTTQCSCPVGTPSAGTPAYPTQLMAAEQSSEPIYLALTGELGAGASAVIRTMPASCLDVQGLDRTLVCSKIAVGCVHGPPAPSCAGVTSAWSQFEVSGSGLVASETYDLTLGGTAHGVTEKKAIGPITADDHGRVSNQLFTLPDIPAHDPWTLTATPRDAGQVVTTTLETGEIDCVALFAGSGSFTSQIAAVGMTPNSLFKEIVDGVTQPSVQADVNGTVPVTEIDGSCRPGLVQIQLTGFWLDHGVFSDDATKGVNAYC